MTFGCICGWIGKDVERCPKCSRPVYQIIACHWCRTPKHVQFIGGRMYRCQQCDRQFDDEPNEGADCYNDPVKSAEKREENEQFRRQRGRRLPRHKY